ncbi:MAG: D-glycero-beta-D-manno-heptose 1-phosphate adenylyltransferase [Candidatus Omnitrophota bacterium]
MGKIKSQAVLRGIVKRLKERGKRIVFTNGCFDILHPGHIKILTDAKRRGDILIVGLNSDSSIRRIKGSKRPILRERARAEVLAGLSVVDYIVVFKQDTPLTVIRDLCPDVLIKGGDWELKGIIGRQYAGRVVRVKLYPGYSTSAIIEKILKAR